MENQKQEIVKQQIKTGNRGLQLHSLDDMYRFGQYITKSGLAPDSFKTPEQVLVALQTGAEINLSPMQALNSIVVIKGKPTLWGDAALALVKRSGLCEYCHEYFELNGVKLSAKDVQYADLIGYPDGLMAVCETKRKGEDEPVIRYFSVADAKLARLWKKQGPWCTHPKRMLKYKARAFNLRDNFPDVLFGMHLAEEMVGEEPLPAPESDVLPRDQRRGLMVTGARTEPVVNGQEPSRGRRLGVPISAVDTTRAPVQEPEPVTDKEKKFAQTVETEVVETEVDSIVKAAVDAEAEVKKPGPDDGLANAEADTVSGGEAQAKEVDEPQEKPGAELPAEEKEDLKSLYVDVNAAYVALNGQDFIAFASYVLCIDESEISMSKLTEEQLRQIKAYIQTSGVSIE